MSPVFRGSIRVNYPDGTSKRQRLPDAARVAIGGKANILVCYANCLMLIWFERVKGGWRHIKVK